MSYVMPNDYDSYLEDLEKKLLESKNLILSGPPGTGKTYLAKLLANKIVGNEADAVITNDGPVRFVQFHPSYDYTDFVEGLRPVNSSDSNDNSSSKSISFERKDGLFKSFCKYVIVNLSKNKFNSIKLNFNEIDDSQKNEIVNKAESSIINFFSSNNPLELTYLFEAIKARDLFGSNSTSEIAALNSRIEKDQSVFKLKDGFFGEDENNLKISLPNEHSYFVNKSNLQIRIINFFEKCNSFEANVAKSNLKLKPFISHLISFFLFQSDLQETPSELLQEKENYISSVSNTRFITNSSYNNKQYFDNYFPLYVLVIFNLVEQFKSRNSELFIRKKNLELFSPQRYVFIIDEINRGDLGKIFGELFYSIDPDYRGESGRINTQYQNLIAADDCFAKGFYVPDNVYIIGTMNDIDRSVESMDFAIRRRFTFVEVPVLDDDGNITPQELKILDSIADIGEVDRIKARFISLNKKIKDTNGLGKSYQIGASYFKSLKKRNGLINYDEVWNFRLKPLLKEYLRGRPNLDEQLKELKVAYDTEY